MRNKVNDNSNDSDSDSDYLHSHRRIITEHHLYRSIAMPVPDGYKIVDTYTPATSTTPWDYYGMNHIAEFTKALRLGGIESVECLVTHRQRTRPQGSGPGGSVRFGDSHLPDTYEIAVPIPVASAAEEILKKHQQAVKDWLDGKGEKPEACKR